MLRTVANDAGVPADLLMALAWEATRMDPTRATDWAGYGLFDLRDGAEPDVEEAAVLLGVSPDDLIIDPEWNARGAAALLADRARASHGGALPDPDDLESWWPAVEAYSGHHDPAQRREFAVYIYELVRFGVDAPAPTGEAVRFGFVPVDIESIAGPQPAPPPDYSGIYTFTPACSSNYSNQSRSPSSIDRLVIHTTQGSYSGAISWFGNCSSNVSAHYVVRSSDGQITQMVAEEDKAWHVGNWNGRSIGIEHEGWVSEPATWYTPAMYDASAALARDIVSRTGVQADRTHIVAHSEAPGATHTDPGSGWDWDHYMTLVSGSYVSVGKLTGVVAQDDIYNGARLTNATVTLVQTGETQGVDSDGYYLFEDLPAGSYTVVASLSGYEDGTCSKTLSDSSTYWCSIAMVESTDPDPDPDPDPDDDPVDDPGDDEPSDDTGLSDGDPIGDDDPEVNGYARTGCACDASGSSTGWLVLGLVPLLLRRRA